MDEPFHRKVTFSGLGEFTSWAYWAETQEGITVKNSYRDIDDHIVVEYDLDPDLYIEDMKKICNLTDEDIEIIRSNFIDALVRKPS